MIPAVAGADCPPYLKPCGVAERLDVRVHSVLAWIASGELIATNVATKRGGRPTWRIAAADLELFLASRRAVQPSPSSSRPRRREPASVQYFPER